MGVKKIETIADVSMSTIYALTALTENIYDWLTLIILSLQLVYWFEKIIRKVVSKWHK